MRSVFHFHHHVPGMFFLIKRMAQRVRLFTECVKSFWFDTKCWGVTLQLFQDRSQPTPRLRPQANRQENTLQRRQNTHTHTHTDRLSCLQPIVRLVWAPQQDPTLHPIPSSDWSRRILASSKPLQFSICSTIFPGINVFHCSKNSNILWGDIDRITLLKSSVPSLPNS